MNNNTETPFVDEVSNIQQSWEKAIGNFLLSFGKVEWFTYFLLTRLPSENIFDTVKSLPLSRRIKLIQQLLVAREISKETIASITSIFTKALQLSEVRNTLAHNPLYLGFYDGDNGIDFRHQVSKYDKTDKPITLEQLENHCKEIDILSGQCYELEGIVDDELFSKIV